VRLFLNSLRAVLFLLVRLDKLCGLCYDFMKCNCSFQFLETTSAYMPYLRDDTRKVNLPDGKKEER